MFALFTLVHAEQASAPFERDAHGAAVIELAAASLGDFHAVEAVAAHAALMREIGAQSESAAVASEEVETEYVGAARAALARIEEFALEVARSSRLQVTGRHATMRRALAHLQELQRSHKRRLGRRGGWVAAAEGWRARWQRRRPVTRPPSFATAPPHLLRSSALHAAFVGCRHIHLAARGA